MSFKVAAALPIVSLTAWEALIDTLRIKEKETILIHAGAGGVGSMAIQFAKMKGLFVITTARQEHHAYVKKLGADISIDYTKEDVRKKVLEQFPEGLDAVLDCVGGAALRESVHYIKKGGRLLSIVDHDAAKLASKDLRVEFLFADASGARLATIAKEFEKGSFSPPDIMELPLSEAKKAHDLLEARHVLGKIVLKIS
jgi:NADPH2:quinone reductase